MPTRNVVLTQYQADMIDRLVKEGRYQNASEVLRKGLRMVEDEEAKLQALRDAINVGLADSAAGRYRSFESNEELDAFVKSRVAKGARRVKTAAARRRG
jgi:antitoxin ParD1/3/4